MFAIEEFHLADENVTTVPKTLISEKKFPKAMLTDIQENADRREEIFERLFTVCRNPTPWESEISTKMDFEKQLDENTANLDQLQLFGKEMVKSFETAQEKREFLRRQANSQRKEVIQECILDNMKLSIAEFKEIVDRWSELQNKDDTMEMHDLLMKQKIDIEKLMAEKMSLVNICLKERDNVYEEFQKSQLQTELDIAVLADRISSQMDLFQNACKFNLELFQAKLDASQLAQLAENNKRCHEDLQKVVDLIGDEVECFNKYEQKMSRKFERLMIEEAANTKHIFDNLEKNVEKLQLNTQKSHYRNFKKAEILNYNLIIVEKINEERKLITNEKKRGLATLSGRNFDFNLKHSEDQKKFEVKYNNLKNEKERVRLQVLSMSKKSRSLKIQRWEKLRSMWNMTVENGIQSLYQIQQIDRILNEQILMLPWKAFCNDVVNKEKHFIPKIQTKEVEFTANVAAEIMLEKKLLKHILTVIANRSEFLIESEILNILEPYCERKNLIKVSKIFEALKIQDLSSIKTLLNYFRPYLFCQNCNSKTFSTLEETLVADIECENHNLVLEPSCVSKALNEFKKDHCQKRKTSDSVEESLSIKNISNFWQKVDNCMTSSKLQVWKILEHSLNNYMSLLKKRVLLHNECQSLKKQNFELKYATRNFCK